MSQQKTQLLKKLGVLGAILAISIVLLTVLFLPIMQRIAYTVFIATPAVLYWATIGTIITGLLYKFKPSVNTPVGQISLVRIGIIFTVAMALVIGPVAGGVYAHTDMAEQIQTDGEQLDELPDTSQEHIRVLPRQVADNYADSSIQTPQYTLSESDLAYHDGKYHWSYAVTPDNFMVTWRGNQQGAMYVDLEQDSKDTTITEDVFNNGRGQIWFDSYTYQSVLHNPTVLHNWDTTFNAEQNDQPYIAHSTVKHNWKFRFAPIPQVYTVPAHATVELMEPNGNIQTLSPQEAQNNELLESQNFYPYDLAMFKTNSMKYKHGAINKWFWKEDVLEVASLPDGGNDWPLAVPVDSDDSDAPQLDYFIATEPADSGGGVYEVWVFDGQTGEESVQQFDETQIGPQKALDFIERQSEVNRLSSAKPISPVPVVKNGTLYWHAKVIPESESGIIYTAFVNAESGDVTVLEGTEPIYAFLSEEEVEEVQNGTQEDTQEETVTVTVVVTDETGEITGTTEIEVPKGGNANIEIENPEDNSTDTDQTETTTQNG